MKHSDLDEARIAELLTLRQEDRHSFLDALKTSGLTKLGERLRLEKELLAAAHGSSGAVPAPSDVTWAPASEGEPADALSVARARSANLRELLELSRRDHAAFALRCKELGLNTLGQRVQLEQQLHALPEALLEAVPRSPTTPGPRVHYVIATYEGFTKRTHYYPPPGKVLCHHLDKLAALSHRLARITVVKADSSGCERLTPGYYSSAQHHFDHNPLLHVERCENYGFSMGQWLRTYELHGGAYDYYLFMEDDYCPALHGFDASLVELYRRKFPGGVGLLCSVVQGRDEYDGDHGSKGHFPTHWEGSVFVSRETLERLYACPRWGGDPRGWLDRLDATDAACLEQMRRDYVGAYYQLAFSLLFTRAGIKHADYLDEASGEYGGIAGMRLCFPYWCDRTGLYFIHRGDVKRTRYTLDEVRASLIVPVQIKDDEGIRINTHLTP